VNWLSRIYKNLFSSGGSRLVIGLFSNIIRELFRFRIRF